MTTPNMIRPPVGSLGRQEGWAEPEACKTEFGPAAGRSYIPTNAVRETETAMGAISPSQPGQLLQSFSMVRWVGSLVALALAPKCLLCIAGYLGIATGLGLVSVELCGGTADGVGLSLRNGVSALSVLGLGFFALLLGRRFFCSRSNIPVRNDKGRSSEE